MTKSILGIIGGSGLYDMPMDNARWETIESPWGQPSDQLRRGEINGLPIVFLPRHGRGHIYTPSSINYQANIDCLKRAGVTDVISLSAVGSLKENLPPGSSEQPMGKPFHKSVVRQPELVHQQKSLQQESYNPIVGAAAPGPLRSMPREYALDRNSSPNFCATSL